MAHRERDRLVVLKKAQKKRITQEQAAGELRMTPRQVRRLLGRLSKRRRQGGPLTKLRGRPSNRKSRGEDTRANREHPFGRGLSRLRPHSGGRVSEKEAWNRHRSRGVAPDHDDDWTVAGAPPESGEDTFVADTPQLPARTGPVGHQHSRLAGRAGREDVLIHMIDDATSELTAHFVRSDSTEENHAAAVVLSGKAWQTAGVLHRQGKPVPHGSEDATRSKALPREEREPSPPTQIGRALAELGIVWIGAHSPQAKGPVERSFGTAQDRLVKGLRVARVKTLEGANRYLAEDFLPWWNQHLKVAPAHPADAHRLWSGEHDLAAILSEVQTRQVASDYTIRLEGKDLPDCARPDPARPALCQRTDRETPRWRRGSALRRAVSAGNDLYAGGESRDKGIIASHWSAQDRTSETDGSFACCAEPPVQQTQTLRSVRGFPQPHAPPRPDGLRSVNRKNVNKERRAKTARRTLASIPTKASAQEFHQKHSVVPYRKAPPRATGR